jgi:hypothetical protein
MALTASGPKRSITMKYGRMFEKLIKLELQEQGFELASADVFDHVVKLDFVVRRFPHNLVHHSVGVQITVGEPNNKAKMSEFVSVHSGNYKDGVDRCLYMQVDSETDIEQGLSHLIGAIITQFQFDTVHRNSRILGVEIQKDLSYSFFSLNERVAQGVAGTTAPVVQPAPVTTAVKGTPVVQPAIAGLNIALRKSNTQVLTRLEGEVTGYNPIKQEGFIAAMDGNTYWFHFFAVSDDELRQELQALPAESSYAFTIAKKVELEPGVKQKSTDKYPPAKNVAIARYR